MKSKQALGGCLVAPPLLIQVLKKSSTAAYADSQASVCELTRAQCREPVYYTQRLRLQLCPSHFKKQCEVQPGDVAQCYSLHSPRATMDRMGPLQEKPDNGGGGTDSSYLAMVTRRALGRLCFAGKRLFLDWMVAYKGWLAL